MNTVTLIQQANQLADRRANCFGDDCYRDGFQLVCSPQFRKAVEEKNAIPSYAEFDGVICESTVCFKGHKPYFQNRFYIRKGDGFRGAFSLKKAIQKLG